MRLIHNSLGFFVLLVSSLIDLSVSEPRVVCYYTNWSVYRQGTAKFNPQNINPYLCTHLVYAFGGFTKDNQLKPFDKYQDIEQGGYAKFTGLKTYNKNLKTMLAIGGWNEGSTRFSPLVASADRRAQLVKNTIKFLRQNKFDGLDLDWEYPAFRDGGKAKDRENYAKLVQELREEFDREHQKTGRPRLLLTMAVPAGFEYIDKGYDVPKLNKYLDWFNLLSYDYHSAYEPAVNHHAPLYPIEEENEYSFDNDLNINATINYYVKSGADRDKLVLGIPTYGRSYTLFNPDSNEIGAPADGPGEQGDATREKGYLAYYEICQSLKEEDSQWTVVQPNPDALGPYAYNEDQWVGYDDEEIVRRKSEFVVEQKLGGIMFWSIDNDDFRGLCNNKPYPLIEAAKEAYLDGLENGVQRRSSVGANKRKQTTTTTRRPDAKKSGKTTTPAPPTTPASGTDFKCEEEGFYPHPSDCAKYFWCLEAPGLGIVAHHFSCPSGLLFNKQADSCDYARNVFCSTKKSTTTTTEATTTTTTEKVSYNKITAAYKAPPRTTPRTTTTTQAAIDIDASDLDQEDPKVIKELIELIKKAGGIEELEKQISIQEDSSNSAKSATTPATIINKSLVEKIKNRGTLFKSRPPLFNGASQPSERVVEQKTSSTSTQKAVASSDEKSSSVSKKYNSINRFSRPEPQNSGVGEIPESDAVLIEKPQYTSILRRKPVKPEVIAENDYNNESDRASVEVESRPAKEPEVSKKYATISRTRKTTTEQPEEEESDEDDSLEYEEEVTQKQVKTTATTRAPSKYISLNRRRSTTVAPEEEKQEPSTTRAAAVTTTTTTTQTAPTFRRRVITSSATQATTADKTVLTLDTNSDSQILPRNSLDNTLFKSLAADYEQESLIANRHIHDDDDGINHIALPTESITENIPFPDTTITSSPSITATPPSPSLSSQINNANRDQVNENVDDSSLAESATEIFSDIDSTTLSGEVEVEGLVNVESNIGLSKNNLFAPRPFARTKSFTTSSPTSSASTTSFPSITSTSRKSFFSRKSSSRNNENLSSSSNSRNSESVDNETAPTTTVRRRPSVTRTLPVSTEASEEDEAPRTRPTHSYRPGYRGTARFRYSTLRSGEYERNSEEGRYKPLDDNRLRALNLERTGKRPATVATTESTTVEDRTTRRRPFTTRTRPATPSTTQEPEIEEETTTENRIIEAKNRFNLSPDERPERIKFELTAGGKINFGFSSVKSKATETTKEPEKPRIITGPLDKSPIIESGRELKKGHVEEIPIQRAPETVTVQSFSEKLDLSEIPLNKSDIESFVSSDDLKTEAPELEETTVFAKKPRLRPSIIGFKKRVDDEDLATTVETATEEIETTTRTLSRARPSPSRFAFRERVQKVNSEVKNELSEEISSRKISSRNRIAQRGRTGTRSNGEDSSQAYEGGFVRKSQLRPTEDEEKKETTRSRFSGRARFQAQAINNLQESTASEESTTKSYLVKVKASQFRNRQSNTVALDDSENSETQDAPEESSTSRFRLGRKQFAQRISSVETATDADVEDQITERPSAEENEIDYTTVDNFADETTVEPIVPSRLPPKRLTIRKRPAKKLDVFATRQTITTNDLEKLDFETTSSSLLTSESGDDDEVYETEIETATDAKQIETTTEGVETSSKPTRRVLVTRKRVTTEKPTDEETTLEREPVAPRTTTRKRVITIRTKTGAIKQTIDVGNYETTEPSTEAPEETPKIDDSDVVRKRIKVYRSRATTERVVEESSTHKPIYTRSKIFRRPVAQPQEPEITEDVSTTEKLRVGTQRRRIVKVNKRPQEAQPSTTEEPAPEKEEDEEPEVAVIESSSLPPRKKFKVLRTKTPRVIVERPLEEDSLVIKSDDENQNIEQSVAEEEQIEEHKAEEENVETPSEEPKGSRFPTRPGGRVTVRKRPVFGQSRTSTVHPASTRFAGINIQPTRAKQVTRKRYRPSSSASTEAPVVEELDSEKKIELGERRNKIFQKGGFRKTSTTTTNAPNITPHTLDTESEINDYDHEEEEDTTDISQTNNNDGILQTKPRFSLKNRFRTSTTPKPTTLHHVFAIEEDEETQRLKNETARQAESQADEVIKKLQKLIEINRVVEVYSKEEKLKLLKNKKLKSIKAGELTVERPPMVDKFGEISRHVIIKLAKPVVNTTTENPDAARSPKSVMFAETVFGNLETSTISLEGLFEREKKELELKKESAEEEARKTVEIVTPPVAILRPESNETNPLVISIANLDKVILSKVEQKLEEESEDSTTESAVDDETTTLVNQDD